MLVLKNTNLLIPVILIVHLNISNADDYDQQYDKIEIYNLYNEEKYENYIVPQSFDAREKWNTCPSIKKVYDYREYDNNQEHGYDAALAIASMLNDRLCIVTNGSEQFEFSALDIIECCKYFVKVYKDTKRWAAESGSAPFEAALKCGIIKGIVSGGEQGCKPNTKEEFDRIQEGLDAFNCAKPCTGQEKKITYVSRHNKDDTFQTIKIELIINGPVVTRVVIKNPFNWTANIDDIYKEEGPNKNDKSGNFMVLYLKIIGWGKDDTDPYWLVTNFWGDNWKGGGFFKILDQNYYLGLGKNVYAGHFKDIVFEKVTTTEVNDNDDTPPESDRGSVNSLRCLVGFVIVLFGIWFQLP